MIIGQLLTLKYSIELLEQRCTFISKLKVELAWFILSTKVGGNTEKIPKNWSTWFVDAPYGLSA